MLYNFALLMLFIVFVNYLDGVGMIYIEHLLDLGVDGMIG